MRKEQTAVEEFMRKNAFAVRMRIEEPQGGGVTIEGNGVLLTVADMLKPIVQWLKDESKTRLRHDARVARTFLMLEELAETVESMGICSEETLADGLADLAYTVLGTAATFDIPLGAVFDEVHRSNMTKQRKPADHLLKAGKGDAYEPPDIRAAIEMGRAEEKT